LKNPSAATETAPADDPTGAGFSAGCFVRLRLLVLAVAIVTSGLARAEVPPRRIITLMPSLTETVCALGECARLVATDRYSNWPAQVRDLPKAGGLDDADIELIVSLQPDLVILAHATRTTLRLRELGIATLTVETIDFADVARSVTRLGAALGIPGKAQALNRQIDASLQAVVSTARVRLGGRSPSVYYEVDRGPYAAGPHSFIGEMLMRLGTRNIVTPDLGPYPKLNPEYVVRRNPDVIFISAPDALDLGNRPGWDHVRAIREHRLCVFDRDISDTIVRPGPRVAEGLRAIADCLARVSP
jgi:iron complex transport system substrate-binding protein